MNLMCAYCLYLPGRSQGEEALALTVVEGVAVCMRHRHFAASGLGWMRSLRWAQLWEQIMAHGDNTLLKDLEREYDRFEKLALELARQNRVTNLLGTDE
ncbi:MAG: hypothetical protein WC054_00725 [Candidatus Nanopelagicales bacterium]